MQPVDPATTNLAPVVLFRGLMRVPLNDQVGFVQYGLKSRTGHYLTVLDIDADRFAKSHRSMRVKCYKPLVTVFASSRQHKLIRDDANNAGFVALAHLQIGWWNSKDEELTLMNGIYARTAVKVIRLRNFKSGLYNGQCHSTNIRRSSPISLLSTINMGIRRCLCSKWDTSTEES